MKKKFSKIKLNILKYIEYKGYSKRKVYLDTGIANGVLDKETGLSEKNIELFISTYSEVNPTWLLTGEGNMLNIPSIPEDLLSKEKMVDLVNFLINNEDELMQYPIYKNYIEKSVYKFIHTEKK
ncbi:hypothetical protein UJ101_01008 [Flavobacteriaceae bacterium UJ101]|nr:hypothetical protein UJ101_01008 [Flavobacteriaceae bacterium UJ101]